MRVLQPVWLLIIVILLLQGTYMLLPRLKTRLHIIQTASDYNILNLWVLFPGAIGITCWLVVCRSVVRKGLQFAGK